MTKTLQQCLSSEEWYMCPIPLTIFIIFFILFLYAIYTLVRCSQLISEQSNIGEFLFEAKYGKTLKDITRAYVLNMVVLLLSLIIIVFFLHKALPLSWQVGVFNEYFGMTIVFFIFIVSCWNTALFNSMTTKPNDIITVSSIILFVTLTAIILYGVRIYLETRSGTATHKQTKPQQIKQQQQTTASRDAPRMRVGGFQE